MGLAEYRAKRSFRSTPEPPPGAAKGRGDLRFVVQKHEATRPHYDFRLELDSVLKSWAVPKGPSMDPSVKHLAMQTEDHPLEYRKFAGVIPEGNYGAGKVTIWDEGTYEPIEPAKTRAERAVILRRGYKKGDFKFRLNGRKLKGEFVLVKLKGGPMAKGGNNWLLIKHRDQFAKEGQK